MRMLADVHAFTRRVTGFEHVIKKHERPDAAALGGRQWAQNRLAFDIFGAGADHEWRVHGAFQAERVTQGA
jgi:hypothetical protein